MERMATEDAANPHRRAANRAVLLERLDHVHRAARVEPALRREQRPDCDLVSAHKENEQRLHDRRPALPLSPRALAARSTSALRSSNELAYASRRARTRTSIAPICGRSRARTSSRSRRFNVFLATALKPNFATTTAARGAPVAEARCRMSRSCARTRTPERTRRSMSALRVMRRSRGKPSVGSGAGVLAGKLYRQTLAALLPTAAQDSTAPLRIHARAKSVRPDPALVAGAVGGLSHATNLLERREERGEGRADPVGSSLLSPLSMHLNVFRAARWFKPQSVVASSGRQT